MAGVPGKGAKISGMAKKVLILPGALSVGGAEKMARDIGRFAPTGKWEFHYLVFGDRVGAYEGELTERGYTIFHVGQPSHNYIAYVRDLLHLMKREEYAVVHAHTMFSCGWAMLAAKLAGVPKRIAHAHSALKEPRNLGRRCYEFVMGRLILHCATDFAACSPGAGRRLFGRKTWEKRGVLLPNGICAEAFAFDEGKRQRIRTRYGLEGRYVIGHAGHLCPVKNQSFLLELLGELLEIRPNAHLLLLGEGEDREKLEEMARTLGLESRVTMPGNVGDVGAHLSAMDVFAFPSLYEGAPLALLEARANGLPCIVSQGAEENGLPLKKKIWWQAIMGAKRGSAQPVLDIRQAMERVYGLYEQNSDFVSH